MHTSGLFAALYLSLLASSVPASEADPGPTLTPLELKWLRASWPVLNYAEKLQLPVDIIVQPVTATGAVPLAMSVVDGRCKLVLSMRSNPDAESILVSLPDELHTTAIEAMTAHEIAHCWRYLNGMWHTLPAGFIEADSITTASSNLAAMQKDMRHTHREEGFADLVGLAWTWRTHPQQYTTIHAWFERVRSDQPVAGSFHDTRTWLQLAVQPEPFTTATSPFEQAHQLWSRGLFQH